jgi:hypothetical protein
LTKELDDLELGYFAWLKSRVGMEHHQRLLLELYLTPFRWTMDMDENRAGDGLSMRYRYSYSKGLSKEDRDKLDKIRPCSVLEVMISMAVRAEEEYMVSGDDDMTAKWFYHMVASLGLIGMNDVKFDREKVQEKLNKMMNRDYSPNGLGGLFFIPGYDRDDLRTVELWYQMMAYLDYYIYGGE